MQFLQTVSTAFGNTFGVSAFVGLFCTTFYQTFLLQAIEAIFSHSTFGIVTVFFFLRTTASHSLAGLHGLGFILRGGLFGGWQGKSAGSQDR